MMDKDALKELIRQIIQDVQTPKSQLGFPIVTFISVKPTMTVYSSCDLTVQETIKTTR